VRIAVYAHLHRSKIAPTGVGQHLIHMISGLSKRPDIECRVVAPRDELDNQSRIPEGSPLAGMPVRGLPFGRRWLEASWRYLGAPAIDRWSGPADWIYSPTEVYVATRSARLAITVHDLHAFEPDLPWSRTAEHQAFRARWERTMTPILQRAACIVTVSEFTRGRLRDLLGVDPQRVAVVGNGVDPLYLEAPSGAIDTPSDVSPYVLVVGGLTRRKGGDLILRLAAVLARELPQMRVVVAGTGEQELVDAARRHGNVTLLPHVPTRTLVGLLHGATAALCLSRYEGFGMPVLEAMAAGAPVIASRCGALPEVVADAGILVDGEDSHKVAEAIAWLSADPGTREEYRRRGKARAEASSWDRCVDRLLRSLKER
jgi:glycosyltransferase involved in cell wall biosynthesis